MVYSLQDALSYCVVEGRCYFIDLGSNRYFALSHDLSQAFLALRDGGPWSPGLERVASCDADPASSRLDPYCPVPARDGDFGKSRHDAVVLTLRAILAFITAPRRTGGLSLNAVSQSLRRARERAPSAGRRRGLDEVAGAIASAKTFLGDHDRCLRWSFVTARLVIAAGYPGAIVFGVSAHPFSAHCWVQSGELLIGDRIERVRNYTPILAL